MYQDDLLAVGPSSVPSTTFTHTKLRVVPEATAERLKPSLCPIEPQSGSKYWCEISARAFPFSATYLIVLAALST